MTHMQLIFARSRTPGAAIIRAATWSGWSHVALVTPAQTVIEARAFAGVVERPLLELLQHSSRHELVQVSCPDPSAAIAWAREQLGKPYDYLGIFGLGLHRDWNADDRWWCSELVEAALEQGGNKRFRDGSRRITQQHSWMVA